jgi:hypothetical protein
MTFRTAMAVLATAGVALAGAGGASAAHAAKKPVAKQVAGKKVLKRAFATRAAGSEIQHWTVHTDEPGIDLEFTDELYLHVTGAGLIDKVHETRLDSPYAGNETVITQPNGLGDLTGAVTRDRSGAGGPIRTTEGMGSGDWGIASVFATSIKAANGELDLGNARRVTFEGRTAYALTIRDAEPGPANPMTVSLTLFVDATSKQAIAARWGEGSSLWRTVYIQGFERLEDTPANQAHLEF